MLSSSAGWSDAWRRACAVKSRPLRVVSGQCWCCGTGRGEGGAPHEPEESFGCAVFFRFELVGHEGLQRFGGGGGGELAVADFLGGGLVGGVLGLGKGGGGRWGDLDVTEHVIFDGREGHGAELI